MKSDKLTQIISLITCLLLMVAVAINRDHKIFGQPLDKEPSAQAKAQNTDTLRTLPNGDMVVNTTTLTPKVMGYGGAVPVEIYIHQDRIEKIVPLKNSETPEFFDQAKTLLSQWTGKSIEEASKVKVDAVSGATFSSKALINNVEAGLAYAKKQAPEKNMGQTFDLSPKNIAGLVVVIIALFVPLFVRNKRYKLVQLGLNVVVLGFWCGTFLSYTTIVKTFANGIDWKTELTLAAMFIAAFLYPLFGKKSYYCNNICPLGSLQELAGKCSKRKWRIPAHWNTALTNFRRGLWSALMIVMLCGVGFNWMDYEFFSAFLFTTASPIVVAAAALFIVLSIFVPHPYCRFVCPTGTLFKFSQNSK